MKWFLVLMLAGYALASTVHTAFAQEINITVRPLTDSTGIITITPEGGTHGDYLVEQQLISKIEDVVNWRQCPGISSWSFWIDSISTYYGGCGLLQAARLVYTKSLRVRPLDSLGLNILFEQPSEVFSQLSGMGVKEEAELYGKTVDVLRYKESYWHIREFVYRQRKN